MTTMDVASQQQQQQQQQQGGGGSHSPRPSPQNATSKRAPPLDLPSRFAAFSDANDPNGGAAAANSGVPPSPASARMPHSARALRPHNHHHHHPHHHQQKYGNGSRAGGPMHGRKYSLPGSSGSPGSINMNMFVGMPQPQPQPQPQRHRPLYTAQIPTSSLPRTGSGSLYGDDYAAMAAAGCWHGGMPPPVALYGPWIGGYEFAWGQQQQQQHSRNGRHHNSHHSHHSRQSSASQQQHGPAGGCFIGTTACRASEKSTRVLFVSGLSPSLEDAELRRLASRIGPVRGLDASGRDASAGAYIAYCDLRHAEAAAEQLPEMLAACGGGDESSCIVVEFMVPPAGVPVMENQGVVVASGGAEEMSNTEARALFGKYGEVKATWKSCGGQRRAVEFYDTRAAEAVVAGLKSAFKGKVEFGSTEHSSGGSSSSSSSSSNNNSSSSSSSSNSNSNSNNNQHVMYAAYSMPGHPPMTGFVKADEAAHTDTMWGMGIGHHGPYGWATYPVQQGGGGYMETQELQGGRLQRMGSGGMGVGGGGMGTGGVGGNGRHGGGVDVFGEDAGGYMVPQSCRTDYYSGQYLGYPHGVPPLPLYGPGQAMAMMQTGIYDGSMGGMQPMDQLLNSPGDISSGSELNAWRPQRPGRVIGDRSYDPGQYEFNLDEAHSKSPTARTTLMIRNIPNKYSQKMLLDVLNRKYSGKYDFFYLPIDFKNRCNLGYAFVNFKNSKVTGEFYKEFHSKSWEEFNSKKVCEITYARVQGRDALIEHFRNSRFPCNEPDYLPLVFEQVEEGPQGKKSNTPVMKATPVHHWTSIQYPNNSAVAAH